MQIIYTLHPTKSKSLLFWWWFCQICSDFINFFAVTFSGELRYR